MANPNFDRDKAAKIVLDADTIGDRKAAEKWEVAERTIRHYRQKLSSDPVFAQVCLEKKRLQDKAWANEIPAAIASCINFLKEAAHECKRDDPDAVHAIAGATKILSEVSMTREVIDARLAGQDRPDDEATG